MHNAFLKKCVSKLVSGPTLDHLNRALKTCSYSVTINLSLRSVRPSPQERILHPANPWADASGDPFRHENPQCHTAFVGEHT